MNLPPPTSPSSTPRWRSSSSTRSRASVLPPFGTTRNMFLSPAGVRRSLPLPSAPEAVSVLMLALTTTRTGLRRPMRMSSDEASVSVAEKRPVRRCFGRPERMRVRLAWKPRSSSRSASSRTSTSSVDVRVTDRPLRDWRNSSSRPGVPTTIGVCWARKRWMSARGVDCLVLMSRSGVGSGDAGSCAVEKAGGSEPDGSSKSDAACSSSVGGGGRQNCWKTAWIWVASSLQERDRARTSAGWGSCGSGVALRAR
jgi:hypothetical protein